MALDIIYGERVTEGVDADAKGGGLWLKAGDLERVSGWAHKPEGFCKGEVCVPLPDLEVRPDGTVDVRVCPSGNVTVKVGA